MKKTLLLFSIIISTFTFAQQKTVENEEINKLKNPSVLNLKNNSLNGFKVFPNPTRNSLTVTIGKLNEGMSFRINDLLGKLVYSRKIVSYDLQNESFKIDMSSFQDGVYMFTMKTKTSSKTIRVVKS